MDELLTNLIGQKDRVSGEILQPGEKVYICEPCQLGYHKDSWEFLNKKCEQCNSSIQNLYTLPLCITFRDISPNTNNNSFINADNLLRSGLEKANNQNYGEAIKYFSEALRLNSNFAEAYYHRGTIYYKLGENQAAIKDFAQAISLNLPKKCIKIADLIAIHKNIGQTVYLKGQIVSVNIDTEYKLINFQFSKNNNKTLYAYVPSKSFSLFYNTFSLTDKNVIIAGKISLNKRYRPVIVINTPSQITEVN